MRFGCILPLAALAMMIFGCWGGTQGLYTFATNMSKTEMTCAQYAQERPTAAWLELTDCSADVFSTIVLTEDGSDYVEKMWMPLHAVDAPGTEAVLVLETDDRAMIDKVDALIGRAGSVSEDDMEAMLKVVLEVREASTMDVDGLIAFGYDLDDDEYSQVSAIGDNLAADFAVLRHGEAPSLMGSLLYLLMSVFGAGLFGVLVMASGGDDE